MANTAFSVEFKTGTPIDIIADDQADYQLQKDAILKAHPGEYVESKKIVGIIVPMTVNNSEPVVIKANEQP